MTPLQRGYCDTTAESNFFGWGGYNFEKSGFMRHFETFDFDIFQCKADDFTYLIDELIVRPGDDAAEGGTEGVVEKVSALAAEIQDKVEQLQELVKKLEQDVMEAPGEYDVKWEEQDYFDEFRRCKYCEGDWMAPDYH